jgi:hypothetical protein
MSLPESPRALRPIGHARNGQPRTHRLASRAHQDAAYRRLATAVLGLDVASLAAELRSARQAILPRAA